MFQAVSTRILEHLAQSGDTQGLLGRPLPGKRPPRETFVLEVHDQLPRTHVVDEGIERGAGEDRLRIASHLQDFHQ